jgi:hypothetical protein
VDAFCVRPSISSRCVFSYNTRCQISPAKTSVTQLTPLPTHINTNYHISRAHPHAPNQARKRQAKYAPITLAPPQFSPIPFLRIPYFPASRVWQHLDLPPRTVMMYLDARAYRTVGKTFANHESQTKGTHFCLLPHIHIPKDEIALFERVRFLGDD